MAELYIRGKDGRPRLIGSTADPQLPGRMTALEERMEVIEAAPGGVPLSDAVDSASSTTAATSKAVKTAWDKAAAATFPAGTRLLFHQAAAPTGWTKQTTVNDAVLRVVSGTTGGGTGGSLAFSALFAAGKAVTLSGNVGETTLLTVDMPAHRHPMFVDSDGSTKVLQNQYCCVENTGASGGYCIAGSPGTIDDVTLGFSGGRGESRPHSHSLSSGTATLDLNVKYTDVIICAKA